MSSQVFSVASTILQIRLIDAFCTFSSIADNSPNFCMTNIYKNTEMSAGIIKFTP